MREGGPTKEAPVGEVIEESSNLGEAEVEVSLTCRTAGSLNSPRAGVLSEEEVREGGQEGREEVARECRRRSANRALRGPRGGSDLLTIRVSILSASQARG